MRNFEFRKCIVGHQFADRRLASQILRKTEVVFELSAAIVGVVHELFHQRQLAGYNLAGARAVNSTAFLGESRTMSWLRHTRYYS